MDTWQELLIHLFKEGREWASDLDPADWRRPLVAKYGVLEDSNLQIIDNLYEATDWVKNPPNDLVKGFVLAPGKYAPKGLVLLAPILKINADKVHLSLQVGILMNDSDNKSFFGYRFESPEGYEEHNFYHAQPIQSLGRGVKHPASVTWYPDKYPTFPLQAKTSLELIASMLLAIRDWNTMLHLSQSDKIHRPVKTLLSQFLDKVAVTTA